MLGLSLQARWGVFASRFLYVRIKVTTESARVVVYRARLLKLRRSGTTQFLLRRTEYAKKIKMKYDVRPWRRAERAALARDKGKLQSGPCSPECSAMLVPVGGRACGGC